MIETRQQAEALHAAIVAREDAWRDLNNCVLMPERQMPDDRLAASANRYIEADRAVTEIGHGLALPPLETVEATEAASPTVKRRGRPPKAKPMPPATKASPDLRTVEQVKAEEAAAGAEPGPNEATDDQAAAGDPAAA